jgi:phosphohistidine phosphatase
MKKLFVVRHAKSSWNHPELDDFDRQLNKRGKRNAPEMGERLLRRGVMPDIMITSPAKRAAATARRIADSIGYPRERIKKDSELYHGSASDTINVLKIQDNKFDAIMIFGHNPGLTDLVNELSDASIYNVPTCGIVEIDFDVRSWADVGNRTGNLVLFDFPKKLLANHE